jgi:hypothetical protein
MDDYVRKLERQAAQGDQKAHELLLNHAARMGLIPSRAQIQSMHHGWAAGNTNDPNPNAAAEFILETWKTLLAGLGERAYAWYQSYYDDPESQGDDGDPEFDYENFQIELQNLSSGFVDPDSVFDFLQPLHEYINGWLENTICAASGADNIPLVLEWEQEFGGGRVTDVDVSYELPQHHNPPRQTCHRCVRGSTGELRRCFLKFSISRGIDPHGGFIPLVDMEWSTLPKLGPDAINDLPNSLYRLPPLWEDWGAGSYPD